MITTIIFDFGGVLIDWNPRNLYRRFFDSAEEMEHFLAEIGFADWNLQQDKGRPFAEGVAELAERFPQHAQLIRAYQDHWEESIGKPIAGSIEIIQKVKMRGYSVYGLSNWSTETFPRTRAKHDFFDLLDGYLISGEVQLVKPDPAIFRTMLDRIRCMPEECLFIDDAEANIDTARRLGFLAILFQSPAQLEHELQHHGIL
jgi:2-haloacid dehalogenase